MATVIRENIGVLNDKIVVTIEKDDYFPSFEKAIKEYSKKANIPGFRKGMVPSGIVKKMVGSSLFAEEVNKSVEKGLVEYMRNEKLEIFAQPLPLPETERLNIDMNQPGEYAFSFEVGLKPEFSIVDLAAAPIKKYKVEISDKMLNEQIEEMFTRNGEMIEEDVISSPDNQVSLHFTETDEAGTEIEGGISKETTLKVSDVKPGFAEQLMGKKVDDHITTKLLEFAGETDQQNVLKELDLEGGEAAEIYFKIEIVKIELLKRKTLNEEFYKEIFPTKEITTEEDFRNELKQEMEAQWANQSRNQMYDQIYHELLNHTNISFPDDFLKRWLTVSGEKEKSPEEVEKEFPGFVNQLKWTLIVDKIVADHQIDVKPEDIRAYAKHQLLGYLNGAMNMDEPWVDSYVDKVTKDKKFVEDTYHRLKTDKLFAWAETQVNPVETPISVEDFNNLQEEHKHEH